MLLCFKGGCDETVQLWNLHTNQLQQVALHRKAVRHLAYIQEVDLLVTASWDKTLQYWDIRQRQAVNSLNLPERAYAFSLQYPLLVLGLADRHIQVHIAGQLLQMHQVACNWLEIAYQLQLC